MATLQLTIEQQATVHEGRAIGKSLTAIAKGLGVDKGDLSRWAKREGLAWSGVPAAADVVRERLAYNRLLLAEAALADAIAIRERLWEEHEVVVNTPTGPQRVTLDLPDAKATAEYAAAIERLVKTHSVMSDFTGGSLVDHAKSTLVQMQTALQRLFADEDGNPLTDEEADTKVAELSAVTTT